MDLTGEGGLQMLSKLICWAFLSYTADAIWISKARTRDFGQHCLSIGGQNEPHYYNFNLHKVGFFKRKKMAITLHTNYLVCFREMVFKAWVGCILWRITRVLLQKIYMALMLVRFQHLLVVYFLSVVGRGGIACINTEV